MPTTPLKECGFEYNNKENLYQVSLKWIKKFDKFDWIDSKNNTTQR